MRHLAIALLLLSQPLMAEPVIIGHSGMQPLELLTLQRIYTGRVVEVSGERINPVNLPPGDPIRAKFLRAYLNQDDSEYIGYWTVRRYVGKGAPPRELGRAHEIIQFVTKTPGAIGYVDERDLTPEANVLRKSP